MRRARLFVVLAAVGSTAALAGCADTVAPTDPTGIQLAVTYTNASGINQVEAFIRRNGPTGPIIAQTGGVEDIANFAAPGKLFGLAETLGTLVHVQVNCLASGVLVASDDGNGELVPLGPAVTAVSRTCVTHDLNLAGDVQVTVDTRTAVAFTAFDVTPPPGTQIPCDGSTSTGISIDFGTTGPATYLAAGDPLTGLGSTSPMPIAAPPYTFNYPGAPTPSTFGVWILAHEPDGAGSAALLLIECPVGSGQATVGTPMVYAMPDYLPGSLGGALAVMYTGATSDLEVLGFAYNQTSGHYDTAQAPSFFGLNLGLGSGVTFTGLWEETNNQFTLAYTDDTGGAAGFHVQTFDYY